MKSTFCLILALFCGFAAAQSAPGYDVFLLAGQSNMVGYGFGPDNAADAAVSPRVFMWDANNSAIVPAKDPIVHNQAPAYVGLGLTFGKSYAASLAANRNVLLVGSAVQGTGFYTGDWQAPNGPLALAAVSRANAAMSAAGAGARFAGILWHQGEADNFASTDPKLYAGYLASLISFFRTSITGATSTTPFVVGEWTYQWMAYNLTNNVNNVSQTGLIQDFHNLPDQVAYTSWVSTACLTSDTDSVIGIHFDALSQRQLGRRYADRLFEAAHGLPQPETSLKAGCNGFFDDGRSYNNGTFPVNFAGSASGPVASINDVARGNVAQFSKGQGLINYSIPASTFNGSYTKMVWFKPGAANYANNLISGVNPGQSHYLAAPTFNGKLYLLAGHSDGNSVVPYIYQEISAQSGSWVNICVVYDASLKTLSAFLNGKLIRKVVSVPPAPAPHGAGPMTLTMGSYGNISGYGTDGYMTGNRVWSVPLTANQVQAIYNYELSYRAGW